MTTEDEGSSLISTILPWPSFFWWNSISQSSGPSLMRHYRGQVSYSDISSEGNERTMTTSTAISKMIINSILEADVYGNVRSCYKCATMSEYSPRSAVGAARIAAPRHK